MPREVASSGLGECEGAVEVDNLAWAGDVVCAFGDACVLGTRISPNSRRQYPSEPDRAERQVLIGREPTEGGQ